MNSNVMHANDRRCDGVLGRRRFIESVSALSVTLLASACTWNRRAPVTPTQIERNKAVALRFKAAQAEKHGEGTIRQLLAYDYRRTRAGMEHLGNNAQGQGFPAPGPYLRTAIPDRVDVIEDVVAEGDTVGLLFRLTGTHQANLFGIPATGRKIDINEVAILRVINGKIIEGWFMADEAGLLKQLGSKLPSRKDGKLIVPRVTNAGEDPDEVLRRLQSRPLNTKEDRQRLIVAQSKGAAPPESVRTTDYRQRRQGFQHLRDYGNAHGVGKQTPTLALPDRRDLIDRFIAEGDEVWMQFKIAGTHKASLYGHAPTGRRIEIPEIGIARFENGKWKDGWYFGDELGMMLQLGALHMLE
jgi:predicted ester cyclase